MQHIRMMTTKFNHFIALDLFCLCRLRPRTNLTMARQAKVLSGLLVLFLDTRWLLKGSTFVANLAC